MNLVLKAQLSSLLRHLFRVRGFLISPPSPLPPHLNPPPPRGEEVIFLTQLGYKFSCKHKEHSIKSFFAMPSVLCAMLFIASAYAVCMT